MRIVPPSRPLTLMALMAAAFGATALPAMAQTAPAAPVTQAAEPGLSVTAVRDWLVSVGAQVGEVQRQDGETFVQVTDGSVGWTVLFNACDATDVCGAVQFSAVFTNPGVTLEKVNDWNRDHRFLKAFYIMGEDAKPLAIVQYDVLIMGGLGVDQLGDHTILWVELLETFGTHIGYFAATPPATPTPAQ
ncbi:YbjN domain-containing protein [Brevundimonas sp.]|uniref:YbjN domain-containing protein n=1 Tax=Brevundimonas sp. TaxID=1871086 RepID=UPI002ABCE20F|nr:YbjN domain-containing protein [Brevundimonas sp.]MDZ4363888.1 YbjN domain-containing protein [Brevundimonas sp.]